MLNGAQANETLSVRVRGRHQNGWEKHNLEPMWKRLMKHVYLEKRTSFLGQVYLRCTQREGKPNKTLDELQKCSNRESVQEQLKSFLVLGKVVQTLLCGPMLSKDMRRNVYFA